MRTLFVLSMILSLGLLFSACFNNNGKAAAQSEANSSTVAKAVSEAENEVDLKVNIKVSVKDPPALVLFPDSDPLPFDLKQDFFEAYKAESWPENDTGDLYGSMPYQVLFDGLLGEDAIEVVRGTSGHALRLNPAVPEDVYSTHASLVATTLTGQIPANFFWFEVDMTTEKQLRDKPNLWERGWVAWNLEANNDPKQTAVLRQVVPYTFYYFYVKESDTTFPGIEVGKLEPANSDTWDCAFDVSPDIATPNIDCDNDGKVDDVIYGAQRFFPFRFDPEEPMHETGDCLVTSSLPRFGFGVGKKHTFRILHHQDSFEIYWLKQTLEGETVAQKLVSCQDLLNPYTQGSIAFYSEDATVLFDNFRVQAFEVANVEPELAANSPAATDTAASETDTLPEPFGVRYQPPSLQIDDLPDLPKTLE
ncbi:MAG: hypothetical protein KC422_03950 [Trueperaceae bacterium]|nr:hypothetical protein [Trueperaceae bacterium]